MTGHANELLAIDPDPAEIKRKQAAARQRRRRAACPRIEYYPDADARSVLEAVSTPYTPWNSSSLTLNRIVKEWAAQRAAPLRKQET